MESFTIITTNASAELADVHARQPAILSSQHFKEWLDPASPQEQVLELVRKPHAGQFEKRPVSTLVNNVRNDSPEVLLPANNSTAQAEATNTA